MFCRIAEIVCLYLGSCNVWLIEFSVGFYNLSILELKYFVEASGTLQENREFIRKSLPFNMAFLSFTTKGVPSSQIFPGVIQHLWCDFFMCGSNIIPHISVPLSVGRSHDSCCSPKQESQVVLGWLNWDVTQWVMEFINLRDQCAYVLSL